MGPEGAEQDWAQWMRAAQDGDQAAYTKLLRAVTPVIRSAVRDRFRDGAESTEDIVQEVLLSLHSVRHTYDPSRPFGPWLGAIMRHRIADRARRYYRRSRNETAVDILPETFDTTPAKSQAEVQDEISAVLRAMADLPPGQRVALELLKVKELSLKEAAAQTGMTIGALKVAVHRAIKAIRIASAKDES